MDGHLSGAFPWELHSEDDNWTFPILSFNSRCPFSTFFLTLILSFIYCSWYKTVHLLVLTMDFKFYPFTKEHHHLPSFCLGASNVSKLGILQMSHSCPELTDQLLPSTCLRAQAWFGHFWVGRGNVEMMNWTLISNTENSYPFLSFLVIFPTTSPFHQSYSMLLLTAICYGWLQNAQTSKSWAFSKYFNYCPKLYLKCLITVSTL